MRLALVLDDWRTKDIADQRDAPWRVRVLTASVRGQASGLPIRITATDSRGDVLTAALENE
jgi:hypothetical protein